MTSQIKDMLKNIKRGYPEDFIFITAKGNSTKEMPRVFFDVVSDGGETRTHKGIKPGEF